MIAINVNISYPGLTVAEEERLRELIRRELQPALARVCCNMVKDGEHVNGEFVDGDSCSLRNCPSTARSRSSMVWP